MKISLMDTNHVMGGKTGCDDPFYYTMPSFEKLSDGDWIVCSRKARSLSDPKGRIEAKRSSDSGKTWVDMLCPTCHDEVQFPGNGFLMCHITQIKVRELIAVYVMIYTDENLPLFNPLTDGMQEACVRMTRSYDDARTWEKPKTLDYKIKDLLIPGKPLNLSDGSIGIPFETHDIWDKGYYMPMSAKFVRSTDNGHSFREGFDIASHPFLLFGDARPMYHANKLWMYFWTYNTKDNRDENVHRVFSSDFGKTWSVPEPIGLCTQITSPADIDDHTVMVVTQDRFSKKPGIKAMLSFDGGMGFDESSACVIFKADSVPDGKNPFAQFEQFKFGYSTVTAISQNTFAVCYWHDNKKTTSVSVSIVSIDMR